MPSSSNQNNAVRSVTRVFNDLSGLLGIQALLLLLTFTLTRSDSGDVRTQLAWTVFLLPGWWFSSWWTAGHASLAIRYAHAVISAVAIHGCIAGAASLAAIGFQGYYVLFLVVLLVLLVFGYRNSGLNRPSQRLPQPSFEMALWIAVMVFAISVFRQPRSADVIQFALQQQDMANSGSLQPSSIGMSAMGISEAMPRWRAHLWHLVPSLLGHATSLPVDDVLRRWAPIPIAFSVFVVLMTVVQRLSGRRVELWAVAIAVFGPVVLWYRSYNAFNYSFRVTNSFCLDKDLSLFLLVPAAVYLAIRWIRGCRRSLVPLLALIPAIMKFHPMTSVYLVLLIPFVVIGYDRRSWFGQRRDNASTRGRFSAMLGFLWPSARARQWIAGTGALFAVVLLLGDAQTGHEQIAGILRADWRDSQTGRPLHYWVGHYAAIESHRLPLDTSQWVDGRLSLRARVLLNCGLLGAMHGAWFICFLGVWRARKLNAVRRWLALTVVLAMLWGMWFVAPSFLTWKPHYLAGYERLHWFAYVPALVAVCSALTFITGLGSSRDKSIPRSSDETIQVGKSTYAWVCGLAVIVLLYSAFCFRVQRESVWAVVPYMNSLLDFELPAQVGRERSYDATAALQDLESTRPKYLRNDDRVLFLENSGNDQFWLIKQGVFWSEPYAEAFAWRSRGDSFLDDRRMFYALLDRKPITGVAAWLDDKNVNLIIDRRPHADSYLQSLNQSERLELRRISPGVWRRPTDAD